LEDYPRDLLKFEVRFSTAASYRAYLAQLRWPEGFRCPACGHGKACRGKLFYRLLQQAMQTAPAPYTALAKGIRQRPERRPRRRRA
jgi:hypothetical protein